MRVKFMVLEASKTAGYDEQNALKNVTDYLSIMEVNEVRFESECYDYERGLHLVKIFGAGLIYAMPVPTEAMIHFINLSDGISFDWTGYYAIRHNPLLRGADDLNSATLAEAAKRNELTWKLFKEDIENGYVA